MAWEYYSKLCSKKRGQFANEAVIIRLWMKSNFELKVHGSSKSSTSKTRFGGMLLLCKCDGIFNVEGLYIQGRLDGAKINTDDLDNS